MMAKRPQLDTKKRTAVDGTQRQWLSPSTDETLALIGAQRPVHRGEERFDIHVLFVLDEKSFLPDSHSWGKNNQLMSLDFMT